MTLIYDASAYDYTPHADEVVVYLAKFDGQKHYAPLRDQDDMFIRHEIDFDLLIHEHQMTELTERLSMRDFWFVILYPPTEDTEFWNAYTEVLNAR